MCPEYHQLASNVDSILSNLTEMTRARLQMFRAKDDAASRRLALEIERTMAELARANCALRKHLAEHKCQGANLP